MKMRDSKSVTPLKNKTSNMQEDKLDAEGITQRRLSAAVNWIFREAGIEKPTDMEQYIALEACRYGDVDRWVEKSYSFNEYFERKNFEIRAFNYFMRKRLLPDKKNIPAIKFFQDAEHRQLAELRMMDATYFE